MLGVEFTWEDSKTWMSLILSATAGWANIYAVIAWRHRHWVQTYYGAVAFLCWVYTAGYVVLISTDDRLSWSLFFSNISPLVWLLVWIIPPIATARTRQQELARLAATTKHVNKLMNERAREGYEL